MKIGIVGCGKIATEHVGIARKLMQDAQVCFCDLNRSNAEKLAGRLGAKGVYTNMDDLLSAEKPDTMHILTPVSSHFTLAEKALYAGCHIYIEKPVTESVVEYMKLSNLAKKQRKLICAGYSALGMPVVIKAKKEIASGKFGRLIAVHCNFGNSWPNNTIPYGDPNHWSYRMRGGVLQNMADHPASLVLNAMDPIEDYKVSFSSRNILPYNCPDLLHVTVRNQHQIGSFTLSLGHGSADKRAHFLLEGGSIVVDMGRQLYSCIRGKGPYNFIKKTLSGITEGCSLIGGTINNILQVTTGKLKKNPGLVNLVTNFYKCVDLKEKLLVPDKTVITVITLLEKVWEEIGYTPKIGRE